MQSLSRDILANIFNVLPWSECLRLESLSSQFRNLSYGQSTLTHLKIFNTFLEESEYIGFCIGYKKDEQNSSRKLYLIEGNEEIDDEEMSDEELDESMDEEMEDEMDEEMEDEMDSDERRENEKLLQIRLGSFSACLDLAAMLFRKLMQRFSFSTVCLDAIPDEFYQKVGTISSDLFDNAILQFATESPTLEKGELMFLGGLSKVRMLEFSGQHNYEQADKLWQLPIFQLTKQLQVFFSGSYTFLSSNVSFGMDDSVLQQVIDRQTIHFASNAKSTVSSGLLSRYVKDCLSGSTHVMHCLKIHFIKPLLLPSNVLADEFIAAGFTMKESSVSTGWYLMEKLLEDHECEEGADPDKIILDFGPSQFSFSTDYAIYRGRTSIVVDGITRHAIQ